MAKRKKHKIRPKGGAKRRPVKKSTGESKHMLVDRSVRKVVKKVSSRTQEGRRKPTTGEIQHRFHSTIREATRSERRITFPIVGIGASAGGIEACTTLFKNLPSETGMAFVVIQHLAPYQESLLPEILARATSMKVQAAEHLMPVAPNCVYVIPPNRNLGIVNGVLRLMPRLETKHQNMPIDFFFRCLSDDQKSNSIGVVLSGGDGDGSQGLMMIKSEGGVTFAQEPSSAKVPSMPRSAVTIGAVDFVLPVEKIASEIMHLGAHPFMAMGPSEQERLPYDEKEFTELIRALRGQLGVDFSNYKRATLQRRLKRRMLLHKVKTVGEYLQFIQNKREEINHLFEDFLINVTHFFRDPDVFAALQSNIFPKLLKKRASGHPVRIWVPGCATGEEAYSIAITLLEVAEDLGVHLPIQVFATDLSEAAIQKARLGIYPEDIKTDVSAERLRKFFFKTANGYQVSSMVREICVFARHDVTRDPPFSRMDLISCRNLLIYLGPVLQRRVIQVFGYALGAGGYLLVGPSETAGASSDLFALADKKNKIYLRKPTALRTPLEVGPPRLFPAFPSLDSATTVAASKGRVVPAERDFQVEVQRVILAKVNPNCIVINDDYEIVQFFGKTSSYLEHQPGEASLNLMKLAKNGLQVKLQAILRKAKATALPVMEREICLHPGRNQIRLDIEVRPLLFSGGNRYYILFFDEMGTQDQRAGVKKSGKVSSRDIKGAKENSLVAQLQQELAATTEYLKSSLREVEVANEELQSANEEILSSNEELQSTNEELETAKEELQSSNEELTTVNEELSSRNVQLSLLYDDLKNLLASVDIPIVMVGNDLRIRRFTPQSEPLLNLIPTDIGRPITDIKPNFEVSELESRILRTIDKMTTYEEQIQDRKGKRYCLRIRPYRASDNKIDGAVLIFVDIPGE